MANISTGFAIIAITTQLRDNSQVPAIINLEVHVLENEALEMDGVILDDGL